VIDRLLAKLRVRDEISPDEEQALRSAVAETRRVRGNETLIRAGEELRSSTLLLDGLMCRYKDNPHGSRQISELHVPGDFADLHSFTLKRLDHNVMTLTPCHIGLVPHEQLKAISEQHPHLTRILWLSTNIDAAIHREWVYSLGQRSALGRMAHLFCELHARLEIVGLTDGTSYPLDVTQDELAECLGVSSVHVNRTLQELRRRGLLEFRGRRVTIHDWDELARVADFDRAYLQLFRAPR